MKVVNTLRFFALIATICLSSFCYGQTPIVYDGLAYVGKPNWQLDQSLALAHAWEITLRDESQALQDQGVPWREANRQASEWTIEPKSIQGVLTGRLADKQMIGLDLEGLKTPGNFLVLREYIRYAKAARPDCKIAIWNQAPNIWLRDSDWLAWEQQRMFRQIIIDESDFAIVGCYSRPGQDFEAWRTQNEPRVVEMRRWYGPDVPIIITISPHYFSTGHPLKPPERLAQELDWAGSQPVEGVFLWYATRPAFSWRAVKSSMQAVTDRVNSQGRYQKPEE